jgi:hypothetical protein
VEWPTSFRLTRPDDHLVVDVTTSGLAAQPTSGGGRGFALVLAPGATSASITLRFPPQQLLEYASDAGGDRDEQPHPIFTDPSVVVLKITPADLPIPATVAGILEAARRLPIQSGSTTVDLPHLLRVRPDEGWSKLRHLPQATGKQGRFELWSSALVDRADATDGSGGRKVRLDLLAQDDDQPGTADDDWAKAVLDEGKLRNTLTRFVAGEVSDNTQGPDQRAALRDLRLSSLGGWLDLRGEWPEVDGVQSFAHVTSMGRDEGQQVGVTGRLFPFGHRAVLTSETVRRLDGDFEADERTAGLRTLAMIRVTDPVAVMDADARALPFTRLEMVTTATPPGDADEPEGIPTDLQDKGLLVLSVGGTPYRFQMQATDHAGGTFLVSMPLLFVSDGTGPDDTDLTDEVVLSVWKDLEGFGDMATDGQAVAVAPPPDGNASPGARGGSSRLRRSGAVPTPDITTMRMKKIRIAPTAEALDHLPDVDDAVDKVGLLAASQLEGVLPTLDRLAPGGAAAVARYADAYVLDAFGGDNAAAGVFLALPTKTLGVTKEAMGGLAALDLGVSALSRERGAVVGDVAKLLAGQPDLGFLLDAPDLLGIVPMTELVPLDVDRLLDEAAEITSEVADGVVTKTIRWSADLFDPTEESPTVGGALDELFVVAPFQPEGAPAPSIAIEQTITLDAGGQQLARRSRCEVKGFELRLLAKAQGPALVTVPFRSLTFTAADGEKPDIDVLMGRLRFGGFLSFLGRLVDIVDEAGFNDPPALAVTDSGVTSSFTFPVPAIAFGIFTLQNISLGAELNIFFNGNKPTLAVRFSRADDRFQLTVAMLGGGGYLEIELDTGGLNRIEGALEFGAAAALDVLVATVSIEVMGGVAVSYTRAGGLTLNAFLRLHGHVDVAGLVSADISLTLTLTYEEQPNLLVGKGELVLELKVLFVSESLRVPVERTFAGQNADPTFAELMAPADFPGRRPWDIYCDAFMEDVA